jgi:hypothetical protein
MEILSKNPTYIDNFAEGGMGMSKQDKQTLFAFKFV